MKFDMELAKDLEFSGCLTRRYNAKTYFLNVKMAKKRPNLRLHGLIPASQFFPNSSNSKMLPTTKILHISGFTISAPILAITVESTNPLSTARIAGDANFGSCLLVVKCKLQLVNGLWKAWEE